MVTMRRIDTVSAAHANRLARRQRAADDSLWALLDSVKDPEVPALSLWELGVLQDIYRVGNTIVVVMTPTYSGCPAMDTMEVDVRARLAEAGHDDVTIVRRLSPAWTTDWLSGMQPDDRCASMELPRPIRCAVRSAIRRMSRSFRSLVPRPARRCIAAMSAVSRSTISNEFDGRRG